MTEEEIKALYTNTDGIEYPDMRDLVTDISISSRLKYVEDTQAKKIAKFLLGYCFKDSQEVYTNGTELVPMFRVLDALERIHQTEIHYCEG